MMQVSIPVEHSVRVFSSTQLNPHVSKCKVKVFYVGRNRNGTYFDEATAREMGSKLPGSPVVGLYNAEKGDFEEHNREFGYDPITKKYTDIDVTKAYGFVAPDAPVWFETFQENGVERTYVCTECYIWTGIYPESQRIVDRGNNQSMELDDKNFSGNWAEDSNTHARFFIVNEAIIEKLCILGEDQQPCFEGSQFKTTFSLHDEFEALKQSMYSLMQDMIQQGGLNSPMNENENKTAMEEQTPTTEYKADPKEEEKKKESEGKEGQDNNEENKESKEGKDNGEKKEEDNKKKEKKYNLAEIEEYQTLKGEYATLQRQYSALQEEKNALAAEIEPLRTFKAQAERAKKEAMINSFYMLSDEDKKDVIANMDTYSLDEIESKLAVIGLHNKVNFGLAEEAESKAAPAKEEETTLLFNLQNVPTNDGIPAWIKAVQETERNL